ncbi:MAG TPA: sugar phosphate nucleotidyltransferase [Acidimicrobiales bacterium]
MRAVILAGGRGTRLRPYTTIIPKPLVPVGDRPILQHIIEQLARCGVDRVDLCVNYLGELIETYFARSTCAPAGVDLRWHWEERPLGTAGALGIIPDLDETFIAMNGDVLTSFDYCDLLRHHREVGADLTIAMTRKPVRIDLGVIETESGWVRRYVEKPTLAYDVSMGIYAYEPSVLRHLPEGPCQFPDFVQLLLEARRKVAVLRSDASWYDIGTPAEYERAISDVSLIDG